MLFNSVEFLIFLPLVFAAYWLLQRSLRAQNLLVVVASYVFYGWWDWRFLILMAFTSLWSYVVGVLELRHWREDRKGSKGLLTISLLVNLGILGYFKYCNFFIQSFADLLSALGVSSASFSSLNVILPVGISFYTFQALSYTIDVYRRTIKPTRDPIAFFAFISFFPQLVAGPIERATNLLPQFLKPRQFDYPLAVEGCRQILCGFFKKVLVADSCAMAANALLGGSPTFLGTWVGMIMFTFQIYGDFSGYSDIAIGCGKLFGIRLMRNFAYPYFARDIAEFWRRWHISLTTWFRDYLYIPLGGSRCGTAKKIRNTFAIFLVSGFWHGANWTFIAWGAFHAVCFLPLLLLKRNRNHVTGIVAAERVIPSFAECTGMAVTFLLVVFGWTFFRAPTIGTAFTWLVAMFDVRKFTLHGCSLISALHAIAPLVILLVVEWVSRRQSLPILPRNKVLRWIVYCALFGFMVYYRPAPQTFIYFQF